jgi:hypothetical protein
LRLSEATKNVADLQITPLHGQFEDHIDEIRRISGRSFTLTFVDPTGWSFDLQKLAPLLRRKPGEVLVNFMYEHFRRFIDDKRAGIRESQDRAFGGSDWRDRYAMLIRQGLDKEDAVLEVFKYQLKKVCAFDYVASARIRHPIASKTHFYLVYGTRHLQGLVEFRKAEKLAILGEEDFRMQAQTHAREDRTGQSSLLGALDAATPSKARDPRAEEHVALEEWLSRTVAKKPYPYDVLLTAGLERFSVTESEFKGILGEQKRRGLIEYVGLAPNRRVPHQGVIIKTLAG